MIYHATRRMFGQFSMLRGNDCLLAALACMVSLCGCERKSAREVVLYASIDETYARRAAEAFEKETGIRVKLVNDTEAAKSTGLVMRLMAEKTQPVADVFWSGDVARALALDRAGMLEAFTPDGADTLPAAARLAEGRIIATAARARVIMIHRELAPSDKPRPQSVEDLAKPEFAPRSCLANPLFGTTAVHAAALFNTWGETRARKFFEDFARNGGKMLASNGEVKRRVGSGEFAFGLTDSDDLHVAWLDGKPVDGIIPVRPEDGGLLLPSAAVLIKGAPHAAEAKRLASWLSGAQVEKLLASSEAAHWPVRSGLEPPLKFRGMAVPAQLNASSWQELDTIMEGLLSGFLTTWVDQQR
ncbi:MAG: extracellular solute-binding protein [Verrucomicrobia bacterium]|nr:extracellular solute-binding protein [Verrucomicrobiota bacterium]